MRHSKRNAVTSRGIGSNTRPNRRILMMAAAAAGLGLAQVGLAVDRAWSGAGDNNLWSNPLNWVGGVAPVANDALIFDGFVRLSPQNNFAASMTFTGITFAPTAGSFTLSGNQLTLGGNIANNTTFLPQTINLPLSLNATRTISVVNQGTLNIGGVMSGAGGITKTGGGLLSLSGTNTVSGPVTISAGVLSAGANAHLGTGSIAIQNGGTLRARSSFTLDAGRSVTVGTAGAGSGVIDVVSGSTLTYGGVIGGGGAGLNKLSMGGLTLSGTNTYTGPTAIMNGTLTLNFAAAGAPASNIINSGSALSLGGANAGLGTISFSALTMAGAGGASNSQTFSGTTIQTSPAVIRANSGSGGSATLNLGALSHQPGGVVVFVPPASGNITTTASNVNGILGGWATIGTGQTPHGGSQIVVGRDWATVDGSGNIVPYTGYTDFSAGMATLHGNVSAATNLRVTADTNGQTIVVNNDGAGTITNVNTINITDPAFGPSDGSGALPRHIIIGQDNTLRLGKFGAIFLSDVTAVPGGNDGSNTLGTEQNVGTLTAGDASGGEIVFNINSTSQSGGRSLSVEVAITDNPDGGSVSVIKTGPGPMKLRGNNSFSGGLFIQQGRLQFAGSELTPTGEPAADYANPDGGGTGPIHINPGGQLFPSGATAAGPIMNEIFLAGIGTQQEPVGAIRMGSGLELAGKMTLTGDARVGGGGTGGATGGGATLSGQITGPFNMDFGAAGNVAGGHSVAILANADLANPNNWTGDTTIVGRTGGTAGNSRLVIGLNEQIPNGVGFGNLILGNTGNTASRTTLDLNGNTETINALVSGPTPENQFVENNAAVASQGHLILGDNNATGSFGGIIRDFGPDIPAADPNNTVAITKIGTGMQTLGGQNTYSGDTNVQGGTLAVNGSLSSSGNVSVSSGATIAGSGSVGHVTVASGGRISPGSTGGGSVGTLSISSLNATATDLRVDFGGSTSDLVQVFGSTSFSGASTVTPLNVAVTGTYTLLQSSNAINYAGGATVTLNPFPSMPNSRPTSGTLDLSDPFAIRINVTGAKSLNWTGAVNSTWDLGAGGTQNWHDGAIAERFFNLDVVTFGDGVANRNITLNSTVEPGGMTFQNSFGNDYSISGSGSIAGLGGLTMNSSGMVTLATNNSFTGPVTINSGTLQIGNGGTSGTLGTGAVENNSLLRFNRSDDFSVSNTISGFGQVEKVGAGTVTVSGTNTYSGTTSINAGTIRVTNFSALGSGPINVASGGALDIGGITAVNAAGGFGGRTVTIAGAGPDGSGAITNTGVAQQNAFQHIFLNDDATIGGTARYDIRGGIATLDLAGRTLTKIGENQFTLVAATVWDGNIVVNEGTLSVETITFMSGTGNVTVNDGGTIMFWNLTGFVDRPMNFNDGRVVNAGTTSNLMSNVTLTGNTEFEITGAAAVMTMEGILSGTGGYTKTGVGTLSVSNANTHSGPVTVNAGTLRIRNGDLATTRAAIQTGFAGGAWNGPGINTGAAAAEPGRALGYEMDGSDIRIIVTWGGDANLSGSVTIADLGILAANWQGTDRFWTQGDFNYDGNVTIADLGILAANWQRGVGAGAELMSFEEAMAMFEVFDGVVVPEPAGLGLLAMGMLGLRRRRRISRDATHRGG